MQRFTVVVWLCLVFSVDAENWTQFRGPQGQGKAPDADLPVGWTDNNIKWRTEIHDKGWSSPVVWGKQIWLTTATPDGHKLYAMCVDFESGKVLHDILVFDIPEPQKSIEKNSYATPTPVIEEGRVYVHYGTHGTACLDTKTGKPIWKREDINVYHHRGAASSPIIDGDKLILVFDGYDKQFVMALDKHTGKTLWKRSRSDDFTYETKKGDLKKAFGTPVVFEIAGERHLVAPGAEAAISYDPETGKMRWWVRTGGMNASAVPMMGHGFVYLSNGMGTFHAVKPSPTNDNREADIAWTLRKGMPKAPSPLLIDDRIFVVNDKTGFATWFDARTGKTIWSERLPGEFSASPLYANGRIYVFSEDNGASVLAAKDEFEVLAKVPGDEGYMASPAVIGDTMILRSKKALYRIEK